MKQLFLLLVLINVAFFGWQYYGEQKSASMTSVIPAEVEQGKMLVLLSEKEQNEQALSQPQQEVVAKPEKLASLPASNEIKLTQSCSSVGPFNQEEIKDAMAQLMTLGVQATQSTSKEKVLSGHWVILEETDAIALAREQLALLKEKGVKDVGVVKVGDNRFVVSLGIFSKTSSKNRRISSLKSLGFDPQVKERFKTVQHYWLDLDVKASEMTVINQLGQDYPQISQVKRACQ